MCAAYTAFLCEGKYATCSVFMYEKESKNAKRIYERVRMKEICIEDARERAGIYGYQV